MNFLRASIRTKKRTAGQIDEPHPDMQLPAFPPHSLHGYGVFYQGRATRPQKPDHGCELVYKLARTAYTTEGKFGKFFLQFFLSQDEQSANPHKHKGLKKSKKMIFFLTRMWTHATRGSRSAGNGSTRNKKKGERDMIELKVTYSGGDIDDSDGAWDCIDIVSDGERVGEATVKTWADGSALIERLDIDDEHQGNGYGTAAIRMISDEHDTTYIVPDSERSARLYDRLGRDVSDDALWGALDQGFGVFRV